MIPSSSRLAGVAQLVEFQPSKLAVEGSNPFSRSNGPDADGRSTPLQGDRLGSIPTVSTKTGVINRVLTRDVSYITVRFGTSNF